MPKVLSVAATAAGTRQVTLDALEPVKKTGVELNFPKFRVQGLIKGLTSVRSPSGSDLRVRGGHARVRLGVKAGVRPLDVKQALREFVHKGVEHRPDERPTNVQVVVPKHRRRRR
eukprot:353829-Prorocentrum_minimum.AAC.2